MHRCVYCVCTCVDGYVVCYLSVTSTGTETRQFYDLFNSSVDERDFMEREVRDIHLPRTLTITTHVHVSPISSVQDCN